MKILKIIGNCCLVFLAIVGVLVSLGYLYVHFFVTDTTTGTNYVDNQIGLDIVKDEDLSEEEINLYEDRYFMEANFFSNAKGNGVALQELKFNYFTDYKLNSNAYRSTGMQFLGDIKPSDLVLEETTEKEVTQNEPRGFCYYDTTNGIDWDGQKLRTQLNRESTFVIKIDNRPFQIQLTGTYEWSEWYGHWYTLGIPIEHKCVLYYTYLNVFVDCMQAIRTNSAGYGDYYITVDLSDYFTIREYDPNTGKYKEDNVTDIIKNYAVLKFHYDENGARNSTQSLFNCIDCNPSYDISDNVIDTEYWQEMMVYTLTEKDFVYRNSETYGGSFMSLSLDMKKLFTEMPRAKVNISIDLQSQYFVDKNITLVGIDYNGFENFEIDTLTIKGQSQKFYLLEKALFDSKLKTLKYSSGIELDISANAINNEYKEVVV